MGVADAAVDGAVAVAVKRKLGCGLEGMKTDLSNAMASSQKRVLEGQLQEFALHTESFRGSFSLKIWYSDPAISTLRTWVRVRE